MKTKLLNVKVPAMKKPQEGPSNKQLAAWDDWLNGKKDQDWEWWNSGYDWGEDDAKWERRQADKQARGRWEYDESLGGYCWVDLKDDEGHDASTSKQQKRTPAAESNKTGNNEAIRSALNRATTSDLADRPENHPQLYTTTEEEVDQSNKPSKAAEKAILTFQLPMR